MPRADRQARIARATELARADPSISKRRLQNKIKSEFGVGLSDAARRQVLERANSPNVLRARLRNRTAFTHHDAVVLRSVLRRTGATPYLVQAINQQWITGHELWKEGLSHQEIRRELKRRAKDAGLIATKRTATRERPDGTIRGGVDWWKLLRRLRDAAIDQGEYVPVPKAKPRTDKGDVKAQKARWRDKQSTKAHAKWVERERARLRTWIAQKNRAIAVSTGARHKQLVDERMNLERTLRSIR